MPMYRGDSLIPAGTLARRRSQREQGSCSSPDGFHQSMSVHVACLWPWVVQHGLSGQDAQGQMLSPLPVGQSVGFAVWRGLHSCLCRQAGGKRHYCEPALGQCCGVMPQLATTSWTVLPTCTSARTSLLQQDVEAGAVHVQERHSCVYK